MKTAIGTPTYMAPQVTRWLAGRLAVTTNRAAAMLSVLSCAVSQLPVPPPSTPSLHFL
jgi:hypothetical protein